VCHGGHESSFKRHRERKLTSSKSRWVEGGIPIQGEEPENAVPTNTHLHARGAEKELRRERTNGGEPGAPCHLRHHEGGEVKVSIRRSFR